MLRRLELELNTVPTITTVENVGTTVRNLGTTVENLGTTVRNLGTTVGNLGTTVADFIKVASGTWGHTDTSGDTF